VSGVAQIYKERGASSSIKNMEMLKYLFFTFFLVCVVAFHGKAQTFTKTLGHDGLTRNYRIHVPANYQEGDVLPLVFNFHGFNSNALEQEIYSQMSAIADEENFFVVYPNGTGLILSWNVGWAIGSDADDIGFTSAMIDTIYAEYNIDTTRVYACGMSNGGFFSYQLACELNNRITKIASVTGSMLESKLESCELENPIPVLQIHGTSDDVVNYNGTTGISMPIEDLLAGWRELNGCTEISDTIAVPNENNLDFSTAELIQYRDCDNSVYMAFYKVDNGGHTWPGALLSIPGVTNRDFSATREIWDFFNDQYPKNQVVDTEVHLLVESLEISVQPNPSADFFYINSNNKTIDKLLIFNTLGQLHRSYNSISGTTYVLESQSWTPGIYFAQILVGENTKTIRLVKR
jgi:polyhydroxybutyrate depolymerase